MWEESPRGTEQTLAPATIITQLVDYETVNAGDRGEMALWGHHQSNTTVESRDVTRVLLSPRMGGSKSPLNRKQPSRKAIEMVEPCGGAIFDAFKSEGDRATTQVEVEDVIVGCDFQSLDDDEGGDDFGDAGVSVGEICKEYVSRQFGRVEGGKKTGSKFTGFYVFASLVFMFLLVKISSLGWLAVQTQSPSSPMVSCISALEASMLHSAC